MQFNMRGFSIIEVLVVVLLLTIIATIGMKTFFGFQEEQSLATYTSITISTLQKARDLTLASKDDTVYGVHFETDTITLFSGGVYSSGASSNEVIDMHSRLNMANTFASGDDVVFTRLTGGVSQAGVVTLSLKSDSSKNQTVTISLSGLVE